MPEKSNRKITIPENGGFLQDLTLRIKLILRLMGDSRVSPVLKLLPIGSLAYLVIPDIAIGPIDDAACYLVGDILVRRTLPTCSGRGTPGGFESHP